MLQTTAPISQDRTSKRDGMLIGSAGCRRVGIRRSPTKRLCERLKAPAHAMMRLVDLGHGFFAEKQPGLFPAQCDLWIVYRHRESKMRRSGMYLPLNRASSAPQIGRVLRSAGAPLETLAAFRALDG